ncbi:MAG: GntP family permease [Micavibrio sp.]|nr:MAG: GntP family permease [Micavibrio sp.]
MTGLLGVLVSLILLMYLAYRGVSVLILGPVMALAAAIFAGGVPLLATYTQVFMPAAGKFIILYFPLFLLGALFGKLMDDSGAARSIAQGIVARLGAARAILAVVLACAVLTYGGVSLFVVAFAVYPIAAALFREADIPKRLIPATIALGAFTFTMTALPGTPAIQNAIPMPYFGTTPFSAPGLGILAALTMFLTGHLWLGHQAKKARKNGEGYGDHPETQVKPDRDMRERSSGEGFDIMEIEARDRAKLRKAEELPSFSAAFFPIVLVIALNYAFSAHLIPAWDTSYLQEPLYGATTTESVRGVWSIILSLTIAILVLIAMNFKRIKNLVASIDSGANAAVLPIFNTASLVGFGAVIAGLPAFLLIQGAVENIGGGPLVSLAVSVNILAGVTGSASGGMSIALQTLGDSYLAAASAANIAPELLHRVTAIATGGLDSLPHNGAVVTLLGICGLTHREAYKDIFMVAVLFPILALVLVVTLGSVFGAF